MRTGLDRILEDPSLLKGRVGLIANPTTVDRAVVHAADRFAAHPDIDLQLLFGPEHGIRSDAQYMEGVGDTRDDITGLPVVSLYGDSFESLSPRPGHLDQIDTLVFDIQDIGTRYYTYAATMALAMRAVGGRDIRVVVLDRPNPLAGVEVEGSGIEPGLESFVGLYSVPQRHGMTVGELARVYRDRHDIDCQLEVVTCAGWSRSQYFDETDLPWVMPSPNMPTLDTALVYPGMCLLEGTTVSEGRGTTRPFELFGAPYIDGTALARALHAMALPGLTCRPCAFTPTFDKYSGELCRGVQLHVTDRGAFRPYRTGIAVLVALRNLYLGAFGWRTEAYEFRDDVLAIDLLTGSSEIRLAIDDEKSLDEVMALNDFALDGFADDRRAALLY